jgi:3-oxoacyl-[acyl-carrier protein] reductase
MLKEKNIIVTGANRGIGKAIVEECARSHANIWACMRTVSDETKEWMESIESENGIFVKPVIIDFEDEESIKRAGSVILEEKLEISGVVNNAGITGSNALFSMTAMEDVRRTFEVNFFGPMFFTQRIMKRLIRQKKCSIVNISSIASFDGEPGQFGYVSSKSAINGATRKLSMELGQFGIRVNAIAPGMVGSERFKAVLEEKFAQKINDIPYGRLAEPDEVANLCLFLASDQSKYITGQIIGIDGGAII